MLALAGGRVYTAPYEDPIIGGTVLIEGPTVTGVAQPGTPHPAGAQTLDCTGLNVTAGFWNCHVHFFERKWANAGQIPAPELEEQLRCFTRHGFTSVFDLGSSWHNTKVIRDRIASGEVRGPAIYSTGEILIPPGALPSEAVLRALGTSPVQPHEVADANDAAAAVDAVLGQNVDALKIFASGNAPSQRLAPDAFSCAVQRAHERHKLVFAHTNDADDVKAALDAGVDVIAHTTPRSGPWDEAVLDAARHNGAALTPTLALWPQLFRHDRISVVKQLTYAAVDQLRAWAHAGLPVLFGTDAGAVDPDPAPEFDLMYAAGMNFGDILASLTTAPAKRFCASHARGRLAQGFQADITVFGDSLGDVRYVLREGHLLYEKA